MSRRIDIELTSARPDGTWTWRAAGAREPRGVLGSTILTFAAKVGDVLRAEVEIELDGTTVLNAAPVKAKAAKAGLLEILPSSKPFEAVTSQLAKRERNERGDRGDRRDRPPRRPDTDRPPRGEGDRRPRREGDRPAGDRAGADRDGGDRRPRRDAERSSRAGGDASGAERRERRQRPHFTPPPELPQRPKPKRLKPGRAYRAAVLAELPEAQRPVAERALQGGIPAVRQAVQEQNARLRAEGKEEIPAAGLIQMAEQLLPKLRVAEWLDRATAAKADLAELALPDLRSVVASSDDPVVARDESTRELAAELKKALHTKQESELLLWLDDITAALGVGRVIRALKLSSQPPKAGVPLPPELATRLASAATASLTPDAMPDRWGALLEAAAFAPVRTLVRPEAPPTHTSEELLATVKRLAPALPQIAPLFNVEVPAGATMPKPMRPTRPTAPAKKAAPKQQPPKQEAPKQESRAHEAPKEEAPKQEAATHEPAEKDTAEATDAPAAESPAEQPDAPAAEALAESTEAAPAAEAPAESTTTTEAESPAEQTDALDAQPVAAVDSPAEPLESATPEPAVVAEVGATETADTSEAS
jgi:hypothetical protein